jgi:hypothetical protein
LKGQYLAIETMITVGIGISVAIGSIAFFESYRQRAYDSDARADARKAASEILMEAEALEDVDSGTVELQLPRQVGSSGYSVSAGEFVNVTSAGRTYSFSAASVGAELTGRSRGSDATLIKSGDQIIMRSS